METVPRGGAGRVRLVVMRPCSWAPAFAGMTGGGRLGAAALSSRDSRERWRCLAAPAASPLPCPSIVIPAEAGTHEHGGAW